MNVPESKIEQLIIQQKITNVKMYSGYAGNKLVGEFPCESETGNPDNVAECVAKMFKEFPQQITKIVGKKHHKGQKDQDVHWSIEYPIANVSAGSSAQSIKEVEKRIRAEIKQESEVELLQKQLAEVEERNKPLNLVVQGLSQAFQVFIPAITGKQAAINAPEPQILDVLDEDVIIAENVTHKKKEMSEQPQPEVHQETIDKIQIAVTNFGKAGFTADDLVFMSNYIVNNPDKVPFIKNFLGIR